MFHIFSDSKKKEILSSTTRRLNRDVSKSNFFKPEDGSQLRSTKV